MRFLQKKHHALHLHQWAQFTNRATLMKFIIRIIIIIFHVHVVRSATSTMNFCFSLDPVAFRIQNSRKIIYFAAIFFTIGT